MSSPHPQQMAPTVASNKEKRESGQWRLSTPDAINPASVWDSDYPLQIPVPSVLGL